MKMQRQPLTTESEPSRLPLHVSAVIWSVAVSVIAAVVPVVRIPLLPLVYLNTHIHEFCHALVGALSGGHVEWIQVFADGSGVTPFRGGSVLLVGPAGYVGSTVVGVLMIAAARTPSSARWVLRTLGFLLAGSMIFWVRFFGENGDALGFSAGVFWVLVLFGLGAKLKGPALVFAVQFIGVQQCLASLNAVMDLIEITRVTERQSDAILMERFTGVPAMAWAAAWLVASVALMGVTARGVWKSSHRAGRSPRG